MELFWRFTDDPDDQGLRTGSFTVVPGNFMDCDLAFPNYQKELFRRENYVTYTGFPLPFKLRPSWSPSESQIFEPLLRAFGTDWSAMATYMESKTPNMVGLQAWIPRHDIGSGLIQSA